MKKILIIIMLLLFPINVYAKDLVIECNDIILENTKETICQIKAKDLSFDVTNIKGKIIVSDNLKILSSSYDDTIWKIFDQKFSVEDINLISENKNNGNNFIIATFKIRANNKQDTTGEIKFTDVEIGDDNYEGHKFENQKLIINLKYNSENNKINNSSRNIIFIVLILGILMFLGYKYKNR